MIFNGVKRVIFFGAHTDDEMICAGTLHHLTNAGADVHVVTFGPAALQGDPQGTSLPTVEAEWHRAMDTIGIGKESREHRRMMPSARLAERGQEIADVIYGACAGLRPDLVLTLSPEDENPAHAVVGVQAERVTRGRVPLHVRCQFPWNFHLGRSNLFVTLTEDEVRVKRAVIRAYQSQHFRYNYEEMLLNCCRADGLSVKKDWAEKFELIRGVV